MRFPKRKTDVRQSQTFLTLCFATTQPQDFTWSLILEPRGKGSPHPALLLGDFAIQFSMRAALFGRVICARCRIPGTLIRADVAAGTESRHGNCVPNLPIPLFLHSLKTLFLSTFTVGAKPETRVQSAAAASTKSYEIRSKIACLPHRHAKQPASQGERVTQQIFSSISRGFQ